MDNFDDTESNHSYQSDGVQSNASSLSGLSFYGDEFAELQHLINPSKYPTRNLDRSSTPKAELGTYENEEQANILKANLQQSLQLNEQYKNDIRNLEKQIELKFYNKIETLLRSNTRLEGELENANNQIHRIIENYEEKNNFLVAKEKLDLEKQIYQLTATNSSLQINCTNLNLEKDDLNLENRNLKINLGVFQTDKNIKHASIQSLKQKISEQHIELQNCRKENNVLVNKLNITDIKLQQSERSRDWYKSELHHCQSIVKKSEEERAKDKNQIASLNQKVATLNIEISKFKNDIDQVRLQALKEKEELFRKLENINLNCTSIEKLSSPSADNSAALNSSFDNESFYKLTIEELKEELSRTKLNFQNWEEEFEKLRQENCELIANCLGLQKKLQQSENGIELLENSKKDIVKKLQDLKESHKEKTKEHFQLRNTVTELEIELKSRNEEKQSVENTIGVIRDQFFKFKESHEKVKFELNSKNKEILQLRQEKQDLFMSKNWTICELEKTKEKDIIIANLKRDIVNFETRIDEKAKKIRELEFKILRNDKTVKEKENTILEKVKELENYNLVFIQYKALTSERETKINYLQGELEKAEGDKKEIEENYKTVKKELNRKDLKLDKALRNIEQLQSDHKNILQNLSLENGQILDDFKALEEKHYHELLGKDACITNLHDKFKKLENDCENYKKIITDDQKVDMLMSIKNASQNGAKDVVDFKEDMNGLRITNNSCNLPLFHQNTLLEKMIKTFFNNLNMKECESEVETRLKYLDERLYKIKASCEERMENQYGEDKIKDLEIRLQVKDRDMADKQRKMDRSNRTLLRKVKEHMRGRNSAEKQLKYLQDLYNALSDECNTLKLSTSSKEYTIHALEKLCDEYQIQSDKLRNSVLNLEKDISKSKLCEKCLEMDQLKAKLTVLEQVQEINSQLKDQLRCSEENVLQLTEKVKGQDKHAKSLQEKIYSLSREIEEQNTLLTQSKDLEYKYSSQGGLIHELSQKLTEKENACVINYTIIERLNKELEQAKENIGILSSDVKTLSSNLQHKVEYSEELLKDKAKLENDYCLKITENQNVVVDLRKSIVLLQNEIENLKNDKFFLQRLSNDLKIALQSYVEYNKNLKEQLNLLAKEKQQFNSLPPNIPDDASIPGKYDDDYIMQLLEENKVPVRHPVTIEIHDCLSKLRNEIFTLQDQIIKKNRVNN